MENEHQALASRYSITPPVDSRFNKREKSKKHSRLQNVQNTELHKGLIVRRRSGEKPAHVNVIKAQYTSTVFSTLSGVDSDDNLEHVFNRSSDKEKRKLKEREKEKKVMSTTRAHERLIKRISDTTDLNTETQEVGMPSVQSKVDPSGGIKQKQGVARALSLSCNAAYFRAAAGLNNFSSSWGRSEMNRRQSMAQIDCPPDRIDFHKVFSALIHMGSSSKKEKDIRQSGKFDSRYKRQKSSEQELQYMEIVNEYIWLEIQIELGRFTEEKLKNERAKVPQILEDIMNFRIEQDCDCSEKVDIEEVDGVKTPGINLKQKSKIDPLYHMCLSEETMTHQREVVVQVEELLIQLDCCEQLFPTSKAFAREFPIYGEKEFESRVKALYLWLNITKDLCHKTKIMGKILGVQHLTDVYWPMIDFESPRYTENRNYSLPVITTQNKDNIPDIMENPPVESDEDVDEDIYVDANDNDQREGQIDLDVTNITAESTPSPTNGEKKRVKFTVDSARSSQASSPVPFMQLPDTSSPLKSPPTPQSPSPQTVNTGNFKFWSPIVTNISRASSEASIDGCDPALISGMYRKYVDKTLRRQGMNKMLVIFHNVLDRTLQRAKEALQQPRNTPSDSDLNKVLFIILIISIFYSNCKELWSTLE